jgi:hypothetical protein
MATRTCGWAVWLLVTLLGCVLARAEEPAKAKEPPRPPIAGAPAIAAAPAAPAQAPSGDEIAQWIRQLDADEFSAREAAQAKLAAAGKAAVAELAKAAVGDSLEVTVRAIDVLKKLYQSSDQATRDAAKEALEKMAKSDRPAAARRAEQILKPAPKPTDPNMGGLFFGGGMGVVQGNIQVMAVGGGGIKKMSVKTVNGVRDIEAEENGKTVKIHDDPQQGIKIEATSKKDGKDVTEKYEAKDADELKKKHPEGYKLYEQYGKNQGGQVQIQVGVGNLQVGPAVPVPAPAPAAPVPGAAPAPPPVAPAAQPVPAPGVPAIQPGPAAVLTDVPGDARIRALKTGIGRLNARIETMAKNAPLEQAPKEVQDDLRNQIRELKERLSGIEKRLGDEQQKPAEKTHP